MLGIAVYVNYILADSDGLVSPESLTKSDNISQSADVDTDNETYGDTEFVNVDKNSTENLSANADDYFAQARLERLTSRDNAIQTIQTAIADCIVYLENDSAKVVVKSDGLDTKQVASIKEIILSEIDVPTENIKIMEMA